MKYEREHNQAIDHPIHLKAKKDADRAVEKEVRRIQKRAALLRARALKINKEAENLERKARDGVHDDDIKKIHHDVVEQGYWAAREDIGEIPRNEDGSYVIPPPNWSVACDGKHVGIFPAEDEIQAKLAAMRQVEGDTWDMTFTAEIHEDETSPSP